MACPPSWRASCTGTSLSWVGHTFHGRHLLRIVPTYASLVVVVGMGAKNCGWWKVAKMANLGGFNINFFLQVAMALDLK